MGKQLSGVSPHLRTFIESQAVFFVGSAPLSGTGSVNVSPKGLDTFRVLGRKRVAYLDLVGSGNETAAHLLENGRITIMFCSFSADPLIVRLYGRGRRVLPGDDAWDELYQQFDPVIGQRQIIDVAVSFVRTSCGFGVPYMNYGGERPTMEDWARKQGESGLTRYRARHNRCSIDGLPDYSVPEP